MRTQRLAVMFFFLSSVYCASAAATERRCGWLENPTPANWWLVDRQATWILMRQGGTEPPGFGRIPDLSQHDYVKTNGNYGYACACIGGTFARRDREATRITSVRQLPLAACRHDPALPKP